MTETAEQTESTDAGGAGTNLLPKLAGILLGLLVVGILFRKFLWVVVQSMMTNVIPILFTPVILELSVAFAGLFIVVLFCHMRRPEQEKEWVYFSQEELDAAASQPAKKKLSLRKKSDVAPVVSDANFEEIGRLLEGDELEVAKRELDDLAGSEGRNPKYVVLKLRLLLQREKWGDAETLIAERLASREKLALACVEAARVFVMRKPRDNEAARRSLEMGKRLSVNAVVNAIDSEGRLQKLA